MFSLELDESDACGKEIVPQVPSDALRFDQEHFHSITNSVPSSVGSFISALTQCGNRACLTE